MKEYKPELQTSARDMDEVKRLANAGADTIFIGHEKFGNRLPGNFTLEEIAEAKDWLHKQGKKIFVMVNAIYHNEHLETLPDYLIELEKINVDGFVSGDQSIFQIIKDIDSSLKLVWDPETLSTNYQTLKYWHKRGLGRATLSNELSLDEAIEIKKKVSFPIDIQVHGMTCIFQSKRKLVRNYYSHIDEDFDPNAKRFMKEIRKPETHYPIFEDINGTHIMSNEDLVMIDHLDEILDAQVDGMFVNGLLKTIDYNERVIALYREAIDTYLADPNEYQMQKESYKEELSKIQPEDRKLNTGFYFREQIY